MLSSLLLSQPVGAAEAVRRITYDVVPGRQRRHKPIKSRNMQVRGEVARQEGTDLVYIVAEHYLLELRHEEASPTPPPSQTHGGRTLTSLREGRGFAIPDSAPTWAFRRAIYLLDSVPGKTTERPSVINFRSTFYQSVLGLSFSVT